MNVQIHTHEKNIQTEEKIWIKNTEMQKNRK